MPTELTLGTTDDHSLVSANMNTERSAVLSISEETGNGNPAMIGSAELAARWRMLVS